MSGSWKASLAELKALTEFLEGLTYLSNKTGVMACAFSHTDVELAGGATLQINSERDESGAIKYFVDEFDD